MSVIRMQFGLPSSFVIRASVDVLLRFTSQSSSSSLGISFRNREGRWNTSPKPRVQAHVRIAQIKFVACAGDRDVKEPTFFFNRIARFERTLLGNIPSVNQMTKTV